MLAGVHGGRFRCDGRFRELQLGSAAHADGVVDLAHAPAIRALPAQLVALGAVDDRGQPVAGATVRLYDLLDNTHFVARWDTAQADIERELKRREAA